MSRLRNAWWNPDDLRLLTSRDFRLDWALSLARLIEMAEGRARH